MGFRQNAYATVWEVKQGKGNYMDARISTSKKDKQTNEYTTDFSSYVRLIGNAAQKGANLQPRDRIRIIDCDVSNSYDKAKNVTYTNYAIFDFDIANQNNYSAPSSVSSGGGYSQPNDFMSIPDEADEKLPFI